MGNAYCMLFPDLILQYGIQAPERCFIYWTGIRCSYCHVYGAAAFTVLFKDRTPKTLQGTFALGRCRRITHHLYVRNIEMQQSVLVISNIEPKNVEVVFISTFDIEHSTFDIFIAA